jgi:hypothetical protein
MGRTYPGIDSRNADFIRAQHVCFVATAPASLDGHLNLSPKGLESFAILNENTVAYLDLVGSGVETVAHLRENGRIVFLFCAFEGPPRLLRLHGTGEAIEPGDPDWDDLARHFPRYAAARSIIRVAVERVSDSCGHGVPEYEFRGDRRHMLEWADRKGPDGIEAYQRENNRASIDALPGLRRVESTDG